MLPVLFTIGPFRVYTFGFFLAVSFILSTFIIWKFAKEDLKEEEYLDAFLYTSFASLVCARIVYILFNFADFGFNILRYIVVREAPGLSLPGGILGGVVFFYWYAKRIKLNFSYLLDLFSLASCFAIVFIKIGEQLSGSSFGKETNFPLAVKVIGLSGRRHPVELYQSLLFLILSICLYIVFQKIHQRKLPFGLSYCLFAVGTALIVFLLEFIKVHSVYLYKLSFNQILALVLIIIVAKPLFDRLKIILLLRKENKLS